MTYVTNNPAGARFAFDNTYGREAVPPLARAQAMRLANPAFIPRNHRVEEALSAAVESGDYAPFATLLNILSCPFDDQPEFAAFAQAAPEGQERYQTF